MTVTVALGTTLLKSRETIIFRRDFAWSELKVSIMFFARSTLSTYTAVRIAILGAVVVCLKDIEVDQEESEDEDDEGDEANHRRTAP